MSPLRAKAWQWPNMLGLDAAAIAVSWMAVFASQNGNLRSPGAPAYLVLGLSVWLTYMADRLFDTLGTPREDLLSIRHQFAHEHRRSLWLFWALTLAATVGLALSGLTDAQLRNGCLLLLLTLAYSLLNLLCSKQFFPKELLVAVLFTVGSHLFILGPQPKLVLAAFGLLCLANCLAIADKERAIDARLQVRSLAQWVRAPAILLLLIASAALAIGSREATALALLASTLSLGLIVHLRHHLGVESYRVLCDATLLIGPALTLGFHLA